MTKSNLWTSFPCPCSAYGILGKDFEEAALGPREVEQAEYHLKAGWVEIAAP